MIAIGWDVRGWQSRDQVTAIARADEHGRIEWLGISPRFAFKPGTSPGLSALVEPALGSDRGREIAATDQIVVAIDAPLALPRALVALASGHAPRTRVPPSEIENPLAYRDCERWIAATFGKKPLSGPFDRLGNNGTLAMTVAANLSEDGFVQVPQAALEAPRAVIEVYPALAKLLPTKASAARKDIARHLPDTLAPGTDEYDAALCALAGLAFACGGAQLGLPALVPFPQDADPAEGWIYAFA